jgi:hypothetical protein
MIEMSWLIGLLSGIGIILIVLDYRDHAKEKENKKRSHESTFFPDKKDEI